MSCLKNTVNKVTNLTGLDRRVRFSQCEGNGPQLYDSKMITYHVLFFGMTIDSEKQSTQRGVSDVTKEPQRFQNAYIPIFINLRLMYYKGRTLILHTTEVVLDRIFTLQVFITYYWGFVVVVFFLHIFEHVYLSKKRDSVT